MNRLSEFLISCALLLGVVSFCFLIYSSEPKYYDYSSPENAPTVTYRCAEPGCKDEASEHQFYCEKHLEQQRIEYTNFLNRQNNCQRSDCSKRAVIAGSYCAEHKCAESECKSSKFSGDYCYHHQKATTRTAPKVKNYEPSYSYPSYPYDPYDVYEYDDPDDFADDWAEEFDDNFDNGYDEAYDYWFESQGIEE